MVSAFPDVNLARLYGCECRHGDLNEIFVETEKYLKQYDIKNKISTLEERGYDVPTNLADLNSLYQRTILPLMPILSTSGITEKSVSINWNADPYPTLITGYNFTLINTDNNQTIKQTRLMSGSRNSFETNLIEGTNYTAYVIAINAQGNSPENNISFKTIGIKVEPEPTPTPTPAPTPTPTPTPIEQTWCIDIYQINEFGGVYPLHKENVKREALLIWEASTMVKQCGDPIPTDQEVKDFYNYADTSIDTNMISQSIGAFKLQNGRVTGDIIYIAETAFNPYYYNKSITSIVQIKDQMGNVIKLKPNNLNFTERERDERISINENVGELNAVKIEFYVWKGINDPKAFSVDKFDEIVAEEIGLDPCPIGQHRDFNNKCVDDDQPIGGTTSLLGKFMGVTALLGTLALLASKRR